MEHEEQVSEGQQERKARELPLKQETTMMIYVGFRSASDCQSRARTPMVLGAVQTQNKIH